MSPGPLTIELPHGLFDDEGTCHRVAALRALAGHEELALAETLDDGPRAVSAWLATLVLRIGGFDAIEPALLDELTRGDRDVLLLAVRASLFGDRIGLVVRCANPACGDAADIDVWVHELIPAVLAPARYLECATPLGTARIREPTGADDIFLEELAGTHRERSAALWSRLVELGPEPMTPARWQALPAPSRHAIALTLAEHGRAPDLALVARCPACRALLELELDPFGLLARELRAGSDRILTEVHALAFHYHWSEADILGLPRPRRWKYLELLARELEGRPLVERWS